MHLNAKRNEYAATLGKLLDKTPKAVLAALVVSYIIKEQEIDLTQKHAEDWHTTIQGELLYEWDILWSNGIVPQKAPRRKP